MIGARSYLLEELFHANYSETISFGKNELLTTRVTGYVVIKAANGLSLDIVVVGWVDNVTIPQGVVG